MNGRQCGIGSIYEQNNVVMNWCLEMFKLRFKHKFMICGWIHDVYSLESSSSRQGAIIEAIKIAKAHLRVARPKWGTKTNKKDQ